MGQVSGHVPFLVGQTITAAGQTQGFNVENYNTLEIEFIVSAIGGVTPSLQFIVETSNDGVNFAPTGVTSTAITANGNTSISIGAGTTNPAEFGDFVRLRYTFGGTTPTATVTAIAVGKG